MLVCVDRANLHHILRERERNYSFPFDWNRFCKHRLGEDAAVGEGGAGGVGSIHQQNDRASGLGVHSASPECKAGGRQVPLPEAAERSITIPFNWERELTQTDKKKIPRSMLPFLST